MNLKNSVLSAVCALLLLSFVLPQSSYACGKKRLEGTYSVSATLIGSIDCESPTLNVQYGSSDWLGRVNWLNASAKDQDYCHRIKVIAESQNDLGKDNPIKFDLVIQDGKIINISLNKASLEAAIDRRFGL